MRVKTNALKKGTRIRLRNGWYATLVDNAKGNTRMADVEGDFRETGSVYSHDIVSAYVANPEAQGIEPVYSWVEVEHTTAQNNLRRHVIAMGG